MAQQQQTMKSLNPTEIRMRMNRKSSNGFSSRKEQRQMSEKLMIFFDVKENSPSEKYTKNCMRETQPTSLSRFPEKPRRTTVQYWNKTPWIAASHQISSGWIRFRKNSSPPRVERDSYARIHRRFTPNPPKWDMNFFDAAIKSMMALGSHKPKHSCDH